MDPATVAGLLGFSGRDLLSVVKEVRQTIREGEAETRKKEETALYIQGEVQKALVGYYGPGLGAPADLRNYGYILDGRLCATSVYTRKEWLGTSIDPQDMVTHVYVAEDDPFECLDVQFRKYGLKVYELQRDLGVQQWDSPLYSVSGNLQRRPGSAVRVHKGRILEVSPVFRAFG